MRIASVAALVAAGLTVTACAESPEQHSARLAVEEASHHAGETTCTGNPRILFAEGPTAKVFVCLVRMGGATCDRYLVRRRGGSYVASLEQRGADCVLPIK